MNTHCRMANQVCRVRTPYLKMRRHNPLFNFSFFAGDDLAGCFATDGTAASDFVFFSTTDALLVTSGNVS
jgi:hypothetical protein